MKTRLTRFNGSPTPLKAEAPADLMLHFIAEVFTVLLELLANKYMGPRSTKWFAILLMVVPLAFLIYLLMTRGL